MWDLGPLPDFLSRGKPPVGERRHAAVGGTGGRQREVPVSAVTVFQYQWDRGARPALRRRRGLAGSVAITCRAGSGLSFGPHSGGVVSANSQGRTDGGTSYTCCRPRRGRRGKPRRGTFRHRDARPSRFRGIQRIRRRRPRRRMISHGDVSVVREPRSPSTLGSGIPPIEIVSCKEVSMEIVLGVL